jgi:hypothetical protein
MTHAKKMRIKNDTGFAFMIPKSNPTGNPRKNESRKYATKRLAILALTPLDMEGR